MAEGKALLWIPDPSGALAGSRLEPAWLPVFYNPVMEFNRDFSVAALQAYINLYAPHKPVTVVEPLTATGVRAVRYALEVEGVGRVIAGDIDWDAVSYAKRNVEANGLRDRVTVTRADASALLYRLSREEPEPILVVDIDPFGSPAPFLDAAVAAIGHRGLLAVTATDLAVLEGSKPQVALRRYHASTARMPHSREEAVRILLGYIARVAAARDKAVRPLASYWADHYVRAYLLVERGARRANWVMEHCVSEALWCVDLGHATFTGCPEPGRVKRIGPLWSCEIGDQDFLSEVERLALTRFSYMSTQRRVSRLASTLAAESTLSGGRFYYEIWALASSLKLNMPPREALAEELEGRGYRVAATHLSPTGLRSDAGVEEVRSIIPLARRRRRRAP